MARKTKNFIGVVVRGEGVATRDFNVPTANLDLGHTADLEHGVYAARVTVGDWEFGGALCYGSGEPPKFEVHLLEFEGDLLGKEIEIEVVEKVGELLDYDSKERLRQKILHDVQLVAEVLKRK